MDVKLQNNKPNIQYQIYDYLTHKLIDTFGSLNEIYPKSRIDPTVPRATRPPIPNKDFFLYKGKKAYLICNVLDPFEIRV
jgi:hypothetical protein